MPVYLKQSTASQEIVLGPFLDSTDGNTAETGLTIANTDIKLWLAGAITLADKTAGGATHIANGVYYATLDATDTATLGSMTIFCHPTGALATKLECCVLAANVYDALIGGGDLLEVDMAQISSDATAANNLETMLDGTGGQALTLGSIVVNNSAGTAVTFTSSGGNGHGISVTGDGTGYGVNAIGGASGGIGVVAAAATGPGMFIQAGGGNANGLTILANGTGAGVSITGGATGNGLDLNGGGASGAGLTIDSTNGSAATITAGGGNGNGLLIAGNGTGAGTRINAGTTGIGLDINGGGTSGVGMTVDSTSGDAVQFTAGGGNGDGLQVSGNGVGHGISATGGATGSGAAFIGGATSGWGFAVIATDGDAAIFQTYAANGNAITLSPTGTGIGIDGTIDAVNTVNGLAANVVTSTALATSAVTEIQTGLSTLDAAGVRTAVGLASANLDTQLGAVPAAVWSATFTLPGQVSPSNTPTAEGALGFMYKLSRNKIEQTATTTSVYDDAGTTVDHKSTISDDATTFTRGEFAAGP